MTDKVVTGAYTTVVVKNPATATDVVVTEAHNTVLTVSQAPKIIVTGMMGPPGSAEISKSNDIDVSNLVSGSCLVYNAVTNKWVATKVLENQIFESGQY